ncbi:hypothetical protein BH23PLA1_BH23PLA1_10370 [soil metagenome]
MSTADASKGVMIGNHPAGLYVLFGAEMWERFSFYGMRALLVLYMVEHLKYDRPSALEVYGTYMGLVYLTPLLGGYLADKYLGQRKAILTGGILMALGHFAMAFENLLYPALGLLILGNGFFKPNISTMVGQLYPQQDTRRDSAYTIFYMGINLGAALAPLACGYLGEDQERFGWHYGFGLAGIGMVLGLLNFALFQQYLGLGGYEPDRPAGRSAGFSIGDWLHVSVLSVLGVGLVWLAWLPALTIQEAVPKLGGFDLGKPVVLGSWVVLALFYVGLANLLQRIFGPRPDGSPIEAARQGDVAHVVQGGRGQPEAPGAEADARDAAPEEEREDSHARFTKRHWGRITVIVIVSLFGTLFWMGFEQAGGTLNLFALERTDRSVPEPLQPLAGEAFPASWYQSVNPILILLLAPLFSLLWTHLDRTRFRVNSAAKMGLGLILLGVGMAVMALAHQRSQTSPLIGPQWLVMVYLLHTMGELCLSPIGLSLVNKLAPVKVASLMMAIWFVCTAAAGYLAGRLEEIVGEEHLWTFLIFSSIIPGVILLALNPLLKKMAHGRI